MTLRWQDDDRTLALSVRDLVEAEPPSGHLVMEVAQTRTARLAAGRAAHVAWQGARADEDEGYRAEVTLKHTIEVAGWTVQLHGRVDGLAEEGGCTIVEEVKSTALDEPRLAATGVADWPLWTAQLELYLWMLARSAWPSPRGRLVLVSLLDGSRHLLGVTLDEAATGERVRVRLERLVRDRERRLAWLARRRAWRVPLPFDGWREGQAAIADRVRLDLGLGRRLLVEAPTGLGKTAAVLHGALAHALGADRQIFWATSRNTQLANVVATLRRFRDRGLPVSWVGLRAKEKVCLHDVVACRPDTCRFAHRYHDKIAEGRVLERTTAEGALEPDAAMALGRAHEVCPYQLLLDTAAEVDVVVGDVNYAFSPTGRLGRFFGEDTAAGWVVIVDEAHQLVDRAREHASPGVDAATARAARDALTGPREAYGELADEVLRAIVAGAAATSGPTRDGVAVTEIAPGPWRALAQRIEELAFDDALLRARTGAGEDDPWLAVARQVLRFAGALDAVGPGTVALADTTPGREALRLLCLDPSPMLRPWIAALGGLVGCSATLTPTSFHRDLLGLPDDTDTLACASPFPPDRRQVLVAPRVSTRWKDRAAHAPATARLLSDAVAAVPGNVALYFSSFAMLDDLVGRLTLEGRELLAQRPGMPEAERAAWLERLGSGGAPVVLAAVLGGIFAEGIDLPPGALAAVVVVGPALPPVGLERDLLREHYETRFGQGFRYASQVPGMTRVVQAAGRLIRRDDDRGTILLVGRRFRWPDFASLLPADWAPELADDPAAAIAAFWSRPA